MLQLQAAIPGIDLQPVRAQYVELISKLRLAGVAVSDRRAVKLQRLLAASALLCQRTTVIPSDMWVLRYIWDTDEQREVIAGIVNAVVEADEQPGQHPRALGAEAPNADAILSEVQALTAQWDQAETSLAERTVIKDQLRYLHGRAQWLPNEVQRSYVQEPLDALWQKVLQA
ncbi:hypothetical protein [Hymenobacter cellulosilyticus]|uniref:ATPase RavA-like AAA lid domain-containing protein n=1 Tax=Hymenobacter cellulosilyticus TaxID=2932248 RepID=A0A8T9Q099_9BACT|nr:hypothetical protein [Hymenobacter cellulosilyticus]UOQ70445.1 hypothetical protein MUN79_17100 [Hymenobacter cellulosilyticus]